MFREKSVSSTRRIALASTLLLPLILFNGCIFSPEKKVVDVIPEAPTVAEKPEDLIQILASVYRQRDITEFAKILANDPVNRAEYLFITASTAQLPDDQWGYTEEVRLHQRMFEPQNTPAGQTPVPAELWLTSVTITLTQETSFTPRSDLYQTPQNQTGLDPAKWKASDAIYGTNVLFDLQGDIDYQVNGRALFVVIEDLTKEIGDDGKFLILQWNDLENSKPALHLPS